MKIEVNSLPPINSRNARLDENWIARAFSHWKHRALVPGVSGAIAGRFGPWAVLGFSLTQTLKDVYMLYAFTEEKKKKKKTKIQP